MGTRILKDGTVPLPSDVLDKVDMKVGDLVDIYVRNGDIVLVKEGSMRGEWDDYFETAPIIDWPDREQP